jgi:DNA-directed RNA polymerase subunit beta
VHIEEFECVARDTKLGKEEITRDIPNVGEEALKDLDDSGIVRIGAEVKPGDILVGKITPKGETQLSPRRSSSARSSARRRATSATPRCASRRASAASSSTRASSRARAPRRTTAPRTSRTRSAQAREGHRDDEIKIIRESAYRRVKKLLTKTHDAGKLVDDKGKVLLAKGVDLTTEALDPIPRKYWKDIEVDKGQDKVQSILAQLDEQVQAVEVLFQEKIAKLSKGDELPPGVIKMVKVYIAIKRKLQVGDKMAGRHGNKGVVSRILPEEDMPYLPDGSPVDLVLNPLGVPSRMNVGQILEVHLGWGALLGKQLQELIAEKKMGIEDLRKHLVKVFNNDRDEEADRGAQRQGAARLRCQAEGRLQARNAGLRRRARDRDQVDARPRERHGEGLRPEVAALPHERADLGPDGPLRRPHGRGSTAT